jgi:hypothetical protein
MAVSGFGNATLRKGNLSNTYHDISEKLDPALV